MTGLNRREFIQVSAASLLLNKLRADGATATPARISESGKTVRAEGANYVWEWSQETDRFRITDPQGHVLASSVLQPIVAVQPVGQKGVRRFVAGRVASHEIQGNRVTWTYEGVNNSAKLTVAWRFDEQGPRMEPVIYQTTAAEDVVSLHYFAEADGDRVKPSLAVNNLVLPGTCESPAISPLANHGLGWNRTSWLGRGAPKGMSLEQQWGLPAHYFCGYRGHAVVDNPGVLHSDALEAFCCGLADLPNGDFFIAQQGGQSSLALELRGDLWGHLRGPGRYTLGATLFWAFGSNFYEAIRQYYLGLMDAGIIKRKMNSARKNAAALAPQWCTWGEQVFRHKDSGRLDEASLTAMYDELKASGLQAGMFSIDDKWEGTYGSLEHDAQRFPHFEQFLDRVRAEGHYLGFWAAFMRCEDPSSLGLTTADMLRRTDGQPYKTGKYYLLDFTRPEVASVLRNQARKFARRYKPDLVKFDFGYEIPALDTVAPHDMSWAGERLLWKGLDVIVKAMREENPDIVVMYYQLSPLFTELLDLHSPDDLFMAAGEYDLEANRRFFFSSLCGEFGMPTYGSSGYEWISGPSIWFDSIAVGTVGSLASFYGSAAPGDGATPERVAKYNGLTHLVRPANQFSIVPLDADYETPTRGAHASSWARMENGEVTLVALRKVRLDGIMGSGKFRDFVSTNASVVVAARSNGSIARATQLGVVPYGDGELNVKLEAGASAQATEHYFGGAHQTKPLTFEKGSLRVPLRERAEDGALVEWIEISILRG
ncbi:MAG: hypothetical protein P4N24_14140 [Acidobacteriota bacterium]|nr:hypothetical protein [Acidobacteriota bacterium]